MTIEFTKVSASPMPMPGSSERRTLRKYPWREMKVGDQFLARDLEYGQVLASTACRRYAPKRWLCRKDKQGKARVWRVE